MAKTPLREKEVVQAIATEESVPQLKTLSVPQLWTWRIDERVSELN